MNELTAATTSSSTGASATTSANHVGGGVTNHSSSNGSANSAGGGGGGNNQNNNHNNNTSGSSMSSGGGNTSSNNHNNNSNNTSASNNKTYRDYNNRHSSGHGQYKKYGHHQNHHYGYNGHNNVHYQRYNNGNGHRSYGNKHYHNSSNYHHHNNHNNHYQGQNYHHQYSQQNHDHHHSGGSNANGGGSSGSSNIQQNTSSSSLHHPNSSTHHGANNVHTSQNQQTQYYNSHTGSAHHFSHHHHSQHNNNGNHHHQQHHRNAPPQVFISSDAIDAYSWAPRRGGGETTSNWSSPNLVDVAGDATTTSTTAVVPLSLNLSALKQGYYSPSPQNASPSPAVSPSTTDSSDLYALQEDGAVGVTAGTGGSTTTNGNATTNGVRHNNFSSNNSSSSCIDTSMHYTTATTGGAILDPNSALNGATLVPSPTNGNAGATTYSYQFHPQGFYTYPGAGPHHMTGGAGGRTLTHHIHPGHHQLLGQNLGLLMPADSSYSMGKADSSMNSSNISEKTLEWSDDGTNLTCSSTASGDRGEDYGNSVMSNAHLDNRTQEYYYAPYTITTQPFTTQNKKRFFNGTGGTGKLSQAVQSQRFHNYQRKMYHLPGFPREWFDDLDPEEYVRAFSKFGEVKERPAALQSPQSDSPRNFPSFGLQVVGSTMSGFGSTTSDVDMCLLVRGSDVDQRYEAVDKLQVLYGAFSATQWLDNVELIYAKVPILKFRDSKRNLEVDLNCNNFVGIRNTHLLYCYSQADWRLKPLVLVVKLWAHYHGINDAKNMTISSYSLVLMVIHFLQCGLKEPLLPVLHQIYPEKFSNTSNILNVKIRETLPPWTSKNKDTLGNLLVQFLEYYGKTFDYTENAVSVRTGRTIPIKQAAAYKSLKNDPHQWKYLCIEEPFDRTNTARSVYDRDTFEKIIGIFNLSYERLQASRNLESIFAPISESDIRAISSSLHVR